MLANRLTRLRNRLYDINKRARRIVGYSTEDLPKCFIQDERGAHSWYHFVNGPRETGHGWGITGWSARPTRGLVAKTSQPIKATPTKPMLRIYYVLSNYGLFFDENLKFVFPWRHGGFGVCEGRDGIERWMYYTLPYCRLENPFLNISIERRWTTRSFDHVIIITFIMRRL